MTNSRTDLKPFLALDVLTEAAKLEAEGRDILHMEIGQPATPAPKAAREAAHRFIDDHKLGYTEGLGIPALRQRIADHYHEQYGLTISAERIAVTTGSSAAFVMAFLASLETGQDVALGVPGYPAYGNILTAMGFGVRYIETSAANHFQPTVDDLEKSWGDEGPFGGLILASPSNPSGTILRRKDLEALNSWAQSKDISVYSDEIYHGISFEEEATSLLQVSDQGYIINSFSKYYSMPGWRIGWMVMPEDKIRLIEQLSQNIYIAAPSLAQYTALAAMDARDDLDQIVATYKANRDYLKEELPKLGLTGLSDAKGAFYFYIDISPIAQSATGLCQDLLHEVGLALTPGNDFDPLNGDHFVRMSFAGSPAEMQDCIKRLKRYLQK